MEIMNKQVRSLYFSLPQANSYVVPLTFAQRACSEFAQLGEKKHVDLQALKQLFTNVQQARAVFQFYSPRVILVSAMVTRIQRRSNVLRTMASIRQNLSQVSLRRALFSVTLLRCHNLRVSSCLDVHCEFTCLIPSTTYRTVISPKCHFRRWDFTHSRSCRFYFLLGRRIQQLRTCPIYPHLTKFLTIFISLLDPRSRTKTSRRI